MTTTDAPRAFKYTVTVKFETRSLLSTEQLQKLLLNALKQSLEVDVQVSVEGYCE